MAVSGWPITTLWRGTCFHQVFLMMPDLLSIPSSRAVGTMGCVVDDDTAASAGATCALLMVLMTVFACRGCAVFWVPGHSLGCPDPGKQKGAILNLFPVPVGGLPLTKSCPATSRGW